MDRPSPLVPWPCVPSPPLPSPRSPLLFVHSSSHLHFVLYALHLHSLYLILYASFAPPLVRLRCMSSPGPLCAAESTQWHLIPCAVLYFVLYTLCLERRSEYTAGAELALPFIIINYIIINYIIINYIIINGSRAGTPVGESRDSEPPAHPPSPGGELREGCLRDALSPHL